MLCRGKPSFSKLYNHKICGSGMPDSKNNINVLDTSPLFESLLNGQAPQFEYKINGNNYQQGYYLTDGIYPDWATFVKSMFQP
jgi:hypothetical protein